VVSLALLISILQAVWILPAQALLVIKTGVANGLPDWRRKMRSKLTRIYLKQLTKVFRHSGMALFFLAAVFVFIGLALQYDWVKVNLLPAENHTSFTVQIKMRDGVAPDDTLAALKTLDNRLRPFFQEGELRVSEYGSGISSKNGKLLLGAHFGGLWFSLNPTARSTTVLQALMLPALDAIPGVEDIWFENEANGGSPGKAIKLEIQGENGPQLYSAIAELQRIIASIPGTSQIRLENIPGAAELKLTLDGAAIQRAGISPAMVSRTLKLFAEGEVVASYTQRNEPVAVRLQAKQSQIQDIKEVLRYSVINDKGNAIPLSQLVTADYRHGPAFIYHSDYLSVRTLQAELDPAQTDVLAANRSIENQWQQIKNRFPGVKVKFSGAIETVQEGLAQLQQLFLFGLGLIFIIVGAQFQSYGLPLLVLLKIPLAFAGVILGLMLSQQAISLYTLYGGVALAGIAVNSAILMFSAAQDRLNTGMSVAHASLYAAKRRMLPILITSLTALVGLLPLASSADKLTNQWQPVASAIVWGVGFSAFFTLFAMPLLFRLTMGWSFRRALK